MENNTEKTDMNVKNSSILSKVKDKLLNKKKVEFTAEYAWLETTYGVGAYQTIEERIAQKQKRIKERIKCQFRQRTVESCIVNPSYYCLISIEDDIEEYIDEVFKPFIYNGFNVVKVNEIEEDNVYVISWKKVFSKEEKKTNGK